MFLEVWLLVLARNYWFSLSGEGVYVGIRSAMDIVHGHAVPIALSFHYQPRHPACESLTWMAFPAANYSEVIPSLRSPELNVAFLTHKSLCQLLSAFMC